MTDEMIHSKNNILSRRASALKDTDKSDHSKAKITAKGHGYLADRILDLAFENDVKVRQDKALTDILSAYDIESPIPLEAIEAVSEILEYVYKANYAVREGKIRYTEDDVVILDTKEKPDIIDI